MGEVAKRSAFAIAITIFLVVVMFAGWGEAGLSAAECRLQRRVGINACKSVLYGKPPSALCCRRIRVTDWKCICPDITPKLAALIDVNRALRIIQGCGRRVPRHFKCGSITTP